MAYRDNANSWARIVLFGDAASQEVSDATLAFFVTGAEQTLCLQYPCTSANGQTTSLTDTTDLANFSEALGRQMAKEFLRTTAGKNQLSQGGTVKIGPVTITTPAVDVSQSQTDIDVDAILAMNRITCVSNVTKSENSTGGNTRYGLGGWRRNQ